MIHSLARLIVLVVGLALGWLVPAAAAATSAR